MDKNEKHTQCSSTVQITKHTFRKVVGSLLCRHLQNANDETVRKRWQSCQVALEEESRAVREKEKKKISSATPYQKIMAKLFDNESSKSGKAAMLPSQEPGSSHKSHASSGRQPTRMPRMQQNPSTSHVHRVMEVRRKRMCDYLSV